jgi:predicted ArsR family transcriptional regulator
MTSKLDKRFFDSTRGRIVALVRTRSRTVNELAQELNLTDNAVRAHLVSLERDGLIRQSGIQRGTRKPHFSYELTTEAEKLFPKAYDVLLNQLIATLKIRLSKAEIEEVLREVGRSLAEAQSAGGNEGDLKKRVSRALAALENIGGAARLEKKENGFAIESDRCPLEAAVARHPEVCTLAETLLTEIIGSEVYERCDRTGAPKCRFEIPASSNGS